MWKRKKEKKNTNQNDSDIVNEKTESNKENDDNSSLSENTTEDNKEIKEEIKKTKHILDDDSDDESDENDNQSESKIEKDSENEEENSQSDQLKDDDYSKSASNENDESNENDNDEDEEKSSSKHILDGGSKNDDEDKSLEILKKNKEKEENSKSTHVLDMNDDDEEEHEIILKKGRPASERDLDDENPNGDEDIQAIEEFEKGIEENLLKERLKTSEFDPFADKLEEEIDLTGWGDDGWDLDQNARLEEMSHEQTLEIAREMGVDPTALSRRGYEKTSESDIFGKEEKMRELRQFVFDNSNLLEREVAVMNLDELKIKVKDIIPEIELRINHRVIATSADVESMKEMEKLNNALEFGKNALKLNKKKIKSSIRKAQKIQRKIEKRIIKLEAKKAKSKK